MSGWKKAVMKTAALTLLCPDSTGVVSDVDLTETEARQLVMNGDVELGAIVLDTDHASL